MATTAAASHNRLIRRVSAQAPTVAARPMTVGGAIQRGAVLLGLVVAVAGVHLVGVGNLVMPVMVGSFLVGFGVGLPVAFQPLTAPRAGPLYAAIQGLALGLISGIMNAAYAGLPMQAVGLTAGVAVAMLVAYRTRLVRVGDRFRAIVVGLTGGVAFFCLIAMALRLPGGITIPFLVEGGVIGIGFSLIVVILASLNLLLDMSSIEEGARVGIPQTYERALATGVTVPMVWLYLEILRLLGKLRR